MFNNNKKNHATRIDTLIGHNTTINGDINFNGGLRIDGSVTGNINAENDLKSVLTLSAKSTITGKVNVPNVIIDGAVSGDVYSTRHVELASNARIKGNLYYRLLEMATGSKVNGQLIHIKEGDETATQLEQEIAAEDQQAAPPQSKQNLD